MVSYGNLYNILTINWTWFYFVILFIILIFFYLLFDFPTVNFGPLPRGKLHESVVNKFILILILTLGEFWSFDHLERLSLSPAESDVVWVENFPIHTLNHSANLPWNENWYFWKLKLCNLLLFQFDFVLFKSMRRAVVMWRNRDAL